MTGPAGPDSESMTDREIVTTRILDAPRVRVFEAWTDPDQLATWWGPEGFRNSFQTFEPRPGGHWRFIMHGPDGQEFQNQSVFVEVAAPDRIVFDHLSGPHFRAITTFEEKEGRTLLTFRMRFGTVAECEAIKRFALEGNEHTFDRLAALLAGA